jgi:hypothetical protein
MSFPLLHASRKKNEFDVTCITHRNILAALFGTLQGKCQMGTLPKVKNVYFVFGRFESSISTKFTVSQYTCSAFMFLTVATS